MKKKFWDKRIPSLLGLFFLAMSIGLLSWLGKNYTEFRSKASEGEAPGSVQISNIADTSFTVSYTTQDQVIGIINYGRDKKFGQVALDDRDKKTSKSSARQVHYITVSHLDPDTKYYFTIQSGSIEFLNNNQPYEITTGIHLSQNIPDQAPINGSVHLQDGITSMDGIVYLSTSASQLLSALLKNDGTYLLPVNSLRTTDLKNYTVLKDNTILQLIIKNAGSQSRVLVNVVNAYSIPLIILSKDYDFTMNTPTANIIASQSANVSLDASSSGFPVFSSNISSEAAILTPKEAENFIDQQPLFRGTASSPYALVVITIESAERIRTSVEADSFGNWEFRPASPLSPGAHTIIINTLNASGIQQKITRSFTVFAEGSQFTEPSVSPLFSPTPTIPISPTPSIIKPTPTIIPTLIVLPTITPTSPIITPTTVVLQTITPTSSPIPSISPPGNSLFLIGGALAALSITAGFMLFFLL